MPHLEGTHRVEQHMTVQNLLLELVGRLRWRFGNAPAR